MSDLTDAIQSAARQMFERPTAGPLSVAIWKALGLTPLGDQLFDALGAKAELTRRDGNQHSFMLLIPIPEGPKACVLAMAWPHPLAKARGEAMRQFFDAAAQYAQRPEVAGVAQIDAFLELDGTVDLRFAWLPGLDAGDRLPSPLNSALLPWGTEARSTDQPPVAPPTGSAIVGLAEVAWKLTKVMSERLQGWPDERGRATPDFQEVRERCNSSVAQFNAAAEALGLEHRMPVARDDDTWLPHNIANALRFHSLPASLQSDLWRVWGHDASDRFAQSWKLLTDRPPHPQREGALERLRDSALQLRPSGGPDSEPKPVDVFVSYAWSDKTRGARDIYEWMRQSGHSAWLDEERRLGSADVDDGIAAAMLRSRCIVICMSMEMIIRGGYALREVLFAIASMPTHCVVAKLDRAPLPSICAGLTVVDWCEPNGPQDLLAALEAQLASSAGSGPAPLELTMRSPLIDNLVVPLRGRESYRRRLDSPNRGTELGLRVRLFGAASRTWWLYGAENMKATVAVAGEAPGLLPWSSLGGPAAQDDPSIFGAALRLRTAVFHAHVNLGAGADWELHNAKAFSYLEEILGIRPDLLRPAPECGWDVSDCRLATQDCLDTLVYAKDWLRGWSPELLVSICGVPSGPAATVESRIESRVALLVDRMLGLRAWEELEIAPVRVPSWSMIWSSIRNDIRGKLESGAHPAVKSYFTELGRFLSPPLVDELAAAMADRVVESRLSDAICSEELSFEQDGVRLRCLIRSAKSVGDKRGSLASVRGTVLGDIRGEGSEEADLNLLFWIFTEPGLAEEWKYGLYMNCAPSERRSRAGKVPPILLNPYLMREMLTDAELDQFNLGRGPMICEET